MKAEIKEIDGINCVVITVPTQKPTVSSSGKSLLVASASNTTDCIVNSKPVKVTINAYIKAD
jgi:hypothetical protein